MSIAVALTELEQVLERYDYAYLVTTAAEGSAHVVAVAARVEDGALWIDDVGRTSRANAAARPHVTVLWPPVHRSDHSLIVDGECTAADSGPVRVVPTRAVLHRPAPAKPVAPGACGSDCVEIGLADGEG